MGVHESEIYNLLKQFSISTYKDGRPASGYESEADLPDGVKSSDSKGNLLRMICDGQERGEPPSDTSEMESSVHMLLSSLGDNVSVKIRCQYCQVDNLTDILLCVYCDSVVYDKLLRILDT